MLPPKIIFESASDAVRKAISPGKLERIMGVTTFRNHEVQSSLTLIPCFNPAHRYSLLSLPCSLFPKI
ncbi:hypothetical protein [Moorena sp. SIO4G3]|uniref:hypothetical protein n=1 Tax=Moorena sp. SIO4G3 TaxID=2607821 RepID=UPI00142D058E|nr:hypothetical protein [Moorena sp. SIO4G3]NEO75334.1 hypothetical protein [Moorena sp. SIO4G3]